MVKEIGSEFCFPDNCTGISIGHKSVKDLLDGSRAVYFNSGRSAILHAYRRYIAPHKILLPAYCCHSMFQGIPEDKVDFYDVNPDLAIDTGSLSDKLCGRDIKALLYVNYFGFPQPQNVMEALRAAREAGVLILEDTTHSLFTALCTEGDYCVCSLRKWFALPDGGAFYPGRHSAAQPKDYQGNTPFFETRAEALRLKGAFVLEHTGDKSEYLEKFRQGEELLDRQTAPCVLSKQSLEILARKSTDLIIDRRRSNFLYLQEHIQNENVTALRRLTDKKTVPMFFPVCCDRRDELRELLGGNSIYCPVHWPRFTHPHFQNCGKAAQISDNILSLPIDQRYTRDDMLRIAQTVNNARL